MTTPRPEPHIAVATAKSVRLGVLLAAVGGFLDAYTYITRGGVFAGAQTGNVVLLGADVAGGRWVEALAFLPPLAAFVLGVATAEFIALPAVAKIVRRPVRAVLVFEILVVLVVGFLPATVPDAVVSVVLAHVAGVQVTTFRVLVDSPFNTTMTTGNLRSMAMAAFHRVVEHDLEAGTRARRFGAVISGFFGGALLGAVAVELFGLRAIWVVAVMLTIALALFVFDERTPRSLPPKGQSPNRSGAIDSNTSPGPGLPSADEPPK
ncbi:YoaK family protein [Rhodococcus sp. IEGM 1330]|uniref:YoaK family protein n=1 Tax=Rhodococcus sp. IEGM 1330 TaxID=3082225 RepID=UPI002953CD44|nr:YoaK family protein [Rhodococcus sp. IEGM 1330]MDV8020235.1 YoaK family protein [Rhodococcus sp. IEGM 1330]